MIVCIVFWNGHYVILWERHPLSRFVLWSLSPSGAVGGGEDIDHGVLSELESRRRVPQDSGRRMAHVKPQNLSFSWEPLINQGFYSSWSSCIFFFVSEGYSGGGTMILSSSPPSSSLCPLLRCQKTGHLLIKSKRKKSRLSITVIAHSKMKFIK